MFLLVAATVALVFVIAVLSSNPDRRNPHVDARRRRRRSRWHVRPPS
jgi:hypothetical protein